MEKFLVLITYFRTTIEIKYKNITIQLFIKRLVLRWYLILLPSCKIHYDIPFRHSVYHYLMPRIQLWSNTDAIYEKY